MEKVKEEAQSKPAARGARLLIVDDDFSVRETLMDILKDTGYEVTGVETGGEAVAAVQKSPYALAIVDLRLPDMGGMQVAERLKEIQKNIYIIIMTGFLSLESVAKAIKDAQYIHLFKPINPDQLMEIIRKRLEQK